MFGCVLGDVHTGATGQVAATVLLEQFPAPFLCSPLSPFLSLASCFISSAAVFQGPRHAYQGGDDLYPGVDLWPFSMLLSPLLRLPHLLRDQVYFRLSLPGPQHLCLIDSVHCCPTQPTHMHTHTRTRAHTPTHTHTLCFPPQIWLWGQQQMLQERGQQLSLQRGQGGARPSSAPTYWRSRKPMLQSWGGASGDAL